MTYFWIGMIICAISGALGQYFGGWGGLIAVVLGATGMLILLQD